MEKCSCCGKEFVSSCLLAHCSDDCLEKDTKGVWSLERREKLQKVFNGWLEQQEKEMAEASS